VCRALPPGRALAVVELLLPRTLIYYIIITL
jgi:hypothetical protein